MRLAPRDVDRLLLHQVGFLAQKRLARGLRLNVPEAIALVTTQLLELARDGRTVAELMDLGRRMLGRRQVLPGVAALVPEVQVEATFRDGTKLVTVHGPIVLEDGDLGLALHGSFLPVPTLEAFGPDAADDEPGAVTAVAGELTINEGLDAIELDVTNDGDRPIQVGSHYPFADTNAALRFDRAAATGRRLDVPAGTAARFEPGEARRVRLVPIAKTEVPS